MKRIYIAHALAGSQGEWGDMQANVNRYMNIVAWATEQGHVVLSWIHHYLTHRAGLTCIDGQNIHEYYLSRDLALLEVADELWLFTPVNASRGCKREVEYAASVGIPVIVKDDWLDSEWSPTREIILDGFSLAEHINRQRR